MSDLSDAKSPALNHLHLSLKKEQQLSVLTQDTAFDLCGEEAQEHI